MEGFGKYKGEGDASSPENYQLKWHKFLIYFGLWFIACSRAGTALMCMQGTVDLYSNQPELVYAQYSGLRTVIVARGIVLLAVVAYMIYVRFQLSGLRTGAPRKLSILFIANIAINLLYLLAVTVITDMTLTSLMGEITGTLFINIIMLFVNQNYYSKRLELFVN